jgi:hypothetical protein
MANHATSLFTTRLVATCVLSFALGSSAAADSDCGQSVGVFVGERMAWQGYWNILDPNNPFTQRSPEAPPIPNYISVPALNFSYRIICRSGVTGRFTAVLKYTEDRSGKMPAATAFSCPSDGATIVGLGLQRDIGDWGRDLVGEAAATESQGSLEIRSAGSNSSFPDCQIDHPKAIASSEPSPLPSMSPVPE